MLISLCVPTFNRAARLKECLEKLAQALDHHPDSLSFEVCVSDNASTDGTGEVIQSFNDRFFKFRKQTHRSNLGFAGNYLSLFSLASGDWVVVFGDDDIASEETLNLLVHCLQDEYRTMVFCQRDSTQPNCISAETTRKRVYDSISSLLESMDLFELSFIGNVVFPRDLALSVADQIDARSAYPSVTLSLKLVGLSGIACVPGKIVQDTSVERDWIPWQPIYTAIDAARIVCEHVNPFATKTVARRHALKLVRSLPRAILLVRSGTLPCLPDNPFRSVQAGNVCQIYSIDCVCFVLAMFLWSVSSAVPLRLGCWIAGVDGNLQEEGTGRGSPRDMCLQETVGATKAL